MQVSVETSKGLERRMRVQVPAEKIENEIEVRLRKVGQQAKIQGFRPGKVPPKVIKQRYGGQVRQEVVQEMVQSSYTEAVQQEQLNPAGGPNIEPEALEEGKDLAYTAVFEVFPEFEVRGLAKIKLESPEVAIAEGDIEEMLDQLRKQRADWAEVDRKACDDDQVTLDFTGTLKGEPFEGGSAENFSLVLGAGQMIEDFEKGLQGVQAGDEKSFKVKFPKDYHVDTLAGAKTEFAVKIHSVSEQVLPEVDDDFVKAYGIESGAIEDLRADIEKNMGREIEAKTRAEVKRQVMEGLAAQNPIEVPGVLVHEEAHSMQQEAMNRMGIQDQADAPSPDTFTEAAEQRVRLSLLLNQLVSENELQVDSERVNEKVDELVAPYENPDEIRNMYMQNPQFRSQIENVVLEEQVVEWIQEQAKVSTKKATFRELMDR